TAGRGANGGNHWELGVAVVRIGFLIVIVSHGSPALPPGGNPAYSDRVKLHGPFCPGALWAHLHNNGRNQGLGRPVVRRACGGAAEMQWPTATFLPSARPRAASKRSCSLPKICRAICPLPCFSQSTCPTMPGPRSMMC